MNYQICTKCVMDTSDPDISFGSAGVCHYHAEFEAIMKQGAAAYHSEGKLRSLIAAIRHRGKGKSYDCLIGLSGGVDSSYLAFQAKLMGLRPLAVHLDNGWNSELAVRNIEGIVRKLDLNLHTVVLDWKEFKALQIAYLKASVVDAEIPTDYAIWAALYKTAAKKGIGYILNGSNLATEYIIPRAWIYQNKLDSTNLRDIERKFGGTGLKSYPLISLRELFYFRTILNIRVVNLLDYTVYDKREAKATIAKEFGWRDYGGKHHESVFTKFYQAYLLPVKFNIDKRRAHLSTLICAGQITREEALAELRNPPYKNEELAVEKEYVLKKLGLSEAEFEEILKLPVRRHKDFANEQAFYNRYHRLLAGSRRFRSFVGLAGRS